MLTIRNLTRGTDLASQVQTATSFRDRLIGLLLTPALPPGGGLWIKPCRSIHTFFMRYPIDVLFLAEDLTVLSLSTVPPWRMSATVWKASGALELPAGSAARTSTQVGDRLTLEPT